MKNPRRIVALAVLLVATFGVRQFRQNRADARVQSVGYLQQVVDEQNRATPRMLDQDVELMNLGAEQATLLVNYRLLNYDGSNVRVDAVRDQVLSAACADTTIRKHILGRGIGIKLHVHDKYGLKATTFAVLPNSC